jgi:hypothetical protein
LAVGFHSIDSLSVVAHGNARSDRGLAGQQENAREKM